MVARLTGLEGGLVMIVVGLILFGAALAAAAIGIVENRNLIIDVHALGQTWTVHAYWVLVAGAVITVVALVGLAMMKTGAARARWRRRERRALARENTRLSSLVAEQRDDVDLSRTADAYSPVDMPASEPTQVAAPSAAEESDHGALGGWFGRHRGAASSHQPT
jgi:hypothetical protein